MSYSFDSRIRFSEVGEDERLTITNIVNYFQDSSNFESHDLGIGAEVLAQKGKAWLLLSWQIEIKRRPKVAERVKISTWPYDFKGFYGNRNYTMEGNDGEVLAFANTIWAYMDVKNQKPTKIDDEELAGYTLQEKLDMEYSPRKVAMPESYREETPFEVRPTNLDLNHHVNNGQYVAMAEPYLPAGVEISQIRVEYRTQATLGKSIVPLIGESDDKITVALCDEEKRPYALVEFGKV